MKKIPKEILFAILTFLPLHTRATPDGNVVVDIKQEPDGLRVSASLKTDTGNPVKRPRDLIYHHYDGKADGSYFLDWMARNFPEQLSFEANATTMSFFIKTSE